MKTLHIGSRRELFVGTASLMLLLCVRRQLLGVPLEVLGLIVDLLRLRFDRDERE